MSLRIDEHTSSEGCSAQAKDIMQERRCFEDPAKQRPSPSRPSRKIMVAIPARNEAERIAACLHALAAQQGQDGSQLSDDFCVLLLVNNSDDGTADIARALAADMPYVLDVLEMTLAGVDASAGGARRIVMAEAARRLIEAGETEGILLTTDADTRVPPRWIADISAILASGVDAVAGSLRLDAADEARLPIALKRRGALEGRYEALLCELESILDPTPWDPWPRHNNEPGASLALTLSSFTAVGGVPQQALGEDRALCDALRIYGYRIRHAHEAGGYDIGPSDRTGAGGMRGYDALTDRRTERAMRPLSSADLVGHAALYFEPNAWQRALCSVARPSPGIAPAAYIHRRANSSAYEAGSQRAAGRTCVLHGTPAPTFREKTSSPPLPAT